MDENRYGSTGGTGDREENKMTLEKPVSLEVQNVPPTRDAYGNGYPGGLTGGSGQAGGGYGYGSNSGGYGQSGSGYGPNNGGGQGAGNYGQFGGGYGQFGGGGYGQNTGNYGQFGGGYGQNNGYGGGNDKRDADNGFGIAAMILGILSLLLFCTCLNWVTGILAIIFAIIQLVRGGQRAYPIVAIITAGVSFLLCIVTYLFFSFSSLNDSSYKNYPYYYYNSYDSYSDYYDSDSYGDENYGYNELPEEEGIKSL